MLQLFFGLLTLIVLALVAPVAGWAGEPGHFAVTSAHVTEQAGVYYLDAHMQLRLSAEAREALRSGVPLTLRLDVELVHRRRFWTDATEATLRQRYQLEYHALAERYVVRNLNSGNQSSFASLQGALTSLTTLDRFPVIDAALVPDKKHLYLRLRVVLDADRLPGPLRLLAFWRRDWSIRSDWYLCPLPTH